MSEAHDRTADGCRVAATAMKAAREGPSELTAYMRSLAPHEVLAGFAAAMSALTDSGSFAAAQAMSRLSVEDIEEWATAYRLLAGLEGGDEDAGA